MKYFKVAVLIFVLFFVGLTSKSNNSDIFIQTDQISMEVSQAWDACVFTDSDGWVSLRDECIDSFDHMFLDEDYWGFNFNNGRDIVVSFKRLNTMRQDVNRLSIHLTPDVYLSPDRPKMRDVFDVKLVEREAIVDYAMHDSQCYELLDNEWRMETAMRDHCKSRDLVLYAYFIDSCVTNFDVYKNVNMPYAVRNRIAEIRGNHRRYDEKYIGYSQFHKYIEEINEGKYKESKQGHIEIDGQLRVAYPALHYSTTVEQLTELNLKNLWVMKRCESMTQVDYLDALETLPLLGVTKESFKSQMWRDLIVLYKQLMTISARSGDQWAIQSIEPPHHKNGDFFLFISQNNPLLFHRYMSTTRYGSKSHEKRLEHAIQAYELAKLEFGEDVSIQGVYSREVLLPTQKLTDYIKLNEFDFPKQYTTELLETIELEEMKTTD